MKEVGRMALTKKLNVSIFSTVKEVAQVLGVVKVSGIVLKKKESSLTVYGLLLL